MDQNGQAGENGHSLKVTRLESARRFCDMMEEEEDEIFSIGEDGEIVEDSEDELEGIKRFSRESYKRIGPVLRRYYLNLPKNMPIKKAVQIDDQEYTAGELSERDLSRFIYALGIREVGEATAMNLALNFKNIKNFLTFFSNSFFNFLIYPIALFIC